jgi:uncharacterized protein (DUF58 family)
MVDPAALMKIKSMELRARRRCASERHYRSPYHGFSVEFTEYRQYAFGDDPRYIDWRVYARSDRFYIKKFQDETNLRCHLLVDHSRSMDYASGDYSKSQYAGTLAATTTSCSRRARRALAISTTDPPVPAAPTGPAIAPPAAASKPRPAAPRPGRLQQPRRC